MRRRTVLPLALTAVCAMLALPAAAATVGSAGVGRLAAVQLTHCDHDARSARFETDMRSISGTERMQLRFALQVRDRDGEWAHVAAPGLDAWVTALPGRTRWVYEKRVERLEPGSYRMQVRFRWRGADGTVLKAATRRSRQCRVPDMRPDLVPLAIHVRPGSAETWEYGVVVRNRGRARAPASMVSLTVDGVPLSDQPAPPLEPRERFTAVFSGPPCPPGGVLVAAVDSTGLVEEAAEPDDTLRVPCP